MKRISVYEWPVKVLTGVLLAVLVLALSRTSLPQAHAHGGEDHGETATASPPAGAGGATITRLADGSVSVPLALQRKHGLRSVVLDAGGAARGVSLPARIVADPSHSAQVVAPQAGTLEAPAAGFPGLGLPVARGQTLVRLRAAFSNQDMADLKAELAGAERDVLVTQQQLDRYNLAGGGAPAPAMGALGAAADPLAKLRIEHAGAVARKAELDAGLARRVTLTAPLAGRIGFVDVYAGRVVAPGDLLFEIVDPRHLWVSAASHDTELNPPSTAYAVGADRRRLPVALVGESHRLSGRALPLLYRLIDPPPGLAVGQALTLHLPGGNAARPLKLPAASLVRKSDGQTLVWVQLEPERFRARPVRVRALDARTWLVDEGLSPGDRVVAAGTALFNGLR